MRHLTLEEVRTVHALVVEQFGGAPGERDAAGLQGALSQPGAEYFGKPLHPTVAEQAASYLYGLCQAHAFTDGNKRTAVFCALVFLQLNGYRLKASDDELFELVVGVAKGQVDKSGLAERLEPLLEEA